MAKLIDDTLMERILELRKEGLSGIKIGRTLNVNEKRVYYYMNAGMRQHIRERMGNYNHKSEVERKRKVINDLQNRIIEAFDDDYMSAYQIRTNIENKYNLSLSADFEDKIEEAIVDFANELGRNTPIKMLRPFGYRINTKSTHALLCGEPVEG